MRNFDYCKYTFLHRKALQYYIEKNNYLTQDEKQALLKRAKVHDMDKLVLYLFREKESASKYHRDHASHHLKQWVPFSDLDLLESIFDYECAALTKPDKPLNAYDTVLNYYSDFKEYYLPVLKRLHMDSSYLAVSEEDKNYINQFIPTEKTILAEIREYLQNNTHAIYTELWNELCSKEEYEKLLKW